jgi:putative acetyltransferase
MITLIRTTSNNTDFISLVRHLDVYLAQKDGDDHSFYAQYNKVDLIKHVVLAIENNQAIGCGAIKEYQSDTMEVKRMYTSPDGRKKGIATQILGELEKWAAELGYERCVLETGKRQPEAIALYLKCGYQIIPNYGQYAEMENSVCFEKKLS